MKVANIVFNPFTNDSRVLKESLSLAKNGYKVEVIAHGDKDLRKIEQKEMVKVVRLSYLDRKITKSKFKKLKIYLQWIKEVIDYTKDFDILHCNDLNTLPVGVIIKKFYNNNVKIVYDAHEFETEINGLKGFQKTLTKILEKLLIKYANKVITVSEAIANEYKKIYPLIKKPALVLNTPPYKEIAKKDIFRETFDIPKDTTIFLYQGGLSKGRGIEILLDTFKQLSTVPITNNKYTNTPTIVFMGYGELEELIKQASKEYKNIYFHPAVSPDILLDYTSSADFGILFYENNCLNHYYCSPNKMFEYLMAEIPVIVSNLYEMKRLTENNHIGVVAKENTPKGLKEAIQEAVKLDKEKLQRNIQRVKEVYNWENQEKVLLKLYKELM
jgi:glycosyltransferase involved in cell wall biosynthesis